MTSRRLHRFLDEQGIDYEVQQHERAVTAQRLAASEHVTGWDVAKSTMLSIDGDLAMVVLPAPVEVDLEKAREAFDGAEIRLANEDEFVGRFDDCEEGAEPPFGNLYDVPVYLDVSFQERERMVCRDGSHTETVSLAVDDFLRAVGPTVVDVGAGP